MNVIGDIIVNGKAFAPADATISVLDVGFQRGYGCFEALRGYEGRPFRMGKHLDRLEASARALSLPEPDRRALEEWILERSEAGGDCIIRVYVTAGTDVERLGTDATTIVLAEALPPAKDSIRVEPRTAPWHSDGEEWELTGAKTLSYGPNMAAQLAARRNGFDDALLIGKGSLVLEGPTFSVGWVRSGIVETPGLELGILESITRGAALEVAETLGLDVVAGEYELDRILGADEVFAMSTVKEVVPVLGVGPATFRPGPVTRRLAAGFRNLIRDELGG